MRTPDSEEVGCTRPVCSRALALTVFLLVVPVQVRAQAAPGNLLLLHDEHDVSVEVAKCLENRLQQERPAIGVVRGEDIRDDVYPWLEPPSLPGSQQDMKSMLAVRAVRDALRGAKLGYVMFLSADTNQRMNDGGMSCAPGAGCLGLRTGERRSTYHAALWTMEPSGGEASLTGRSEGKVMVPALLVPIPLIPATETSICDELAQRAVHFINSARAR